VSQNGIGSGPGRARRARAPIRNAENTIESSAPSTSRQSAAGEARPVSGSRQVAVDLAVSAVLST
jgi:hypothetical protein